MVIRRTLSVSASALICGILSFAATTAVRASDGVADFYKGRSLTLGVPNSAGGGYDVYARVLARHYGKYIPGRPNVVVQNVPAAGGMALSIQLFNTSPRDGSYIGMIRSTTVQEQVLGVPQAKFDGRKFQWIGNMNSDYDGCVVGAASGVKSIDDLYKREVNFGASGAGAQSYTFPVVYRDLLGMKLKIIAGYPGTPERMIALERREIDGFCGISISTFRSQLGGPAKSGQIKLIAQAALRKDARYSDVPNILDEAKTQQDRQALEFLFTPLAIGRALAAPPEVPKARLEALQKALLQTLADPEFLEDANKLNLDIEPANAEETTQIVGKLYSTPAEVVARVKTKIIQ